MHILNEIVVDRGPSPYSVDLAVYIDDNFITTLKGDGLIVSTATGSTAYNLSAGGSIMQTAAKSIALTPLAPCSLSFRPLILTPDAAVRIEKVANGRGAAWVSLDGANRLKLEEGESIVVRGSPHPLPMVVLASDNLTDLWVQRLVKGFGWNQSVQNKPINKKKSEVLGAPGTLEESKDRNELESILKPEKKQKITEPKIDITDKM